MATLEDAVRGFRAKGVYPTNLLGRLANVLRVPAKHVELLYKRSISKVVEPSTVTATDYSDWTRVEMYKEAKKQGLDVNYRTKKADLLKALTA